MKTIAALMAGLMLSTMTFVAGLAIALTFLNIDEPDHVLDTSNTTALWSTAPEPVDKVAQHFERIPARPISKDQTADKNKLAALAKPATDAKSDAITEEKLVDPIKTASLVQQRADHTAIRKAQSAAHIEWCSRRYRSYNAETNTYRPYGGGMSECSSPYSDFAATLPADPRGDDSTGLTAAADDPMQPDEPTIEQASYDGGMTAYADGDHIQSCFDRYRSYRPADNSYQPYDGGPRQQCQ